MSVKHVNSLPEFNDVLRAAGAKLVVVDFHATWCGPCHAIAPRYEQLAREYATRAVFLKVDVDAAEDVARHFSISAMPTFHFHLRSRLVDQISGADPDALANTIARLAPNAADVSFAGEGQRLVADPAAAGAGAASQQSAREASAAAAARRMEAARAQRAAAAAAAAEAAPEKSRPAASASGSGPGPSAAPAPAPAAAPAGAADSQPARNDARLKVNETLLQQMVDEMGFPRVRAEKALILTGNSGLEAAVEWCFEHADDADVDEPLQVVTREGAPKPKLSPEDAKRRADELMRRAREKREADDKKDAAERERQRLRSGKEATLARQKLEEAERKRVVEQKRREKREAQAERQRVREMLEADKQRRHERFNMGPVTPSPQQQLQQQRQQQPVSQPPSAAAAAGKIQFRMPDGSRLEGEFEAEHTMADLVSFLVAKRPELGAHDIRLSQQYPRKTYSQGDYARSLADLKLLPRGALTVSL